MQKSNCESVSHLDGEKPLSKKTTPKMRGGLRKTRQRKIASEVVSSLAPDSTASPLASTPKRGRGHTQLLHSTPDHCSSTDSRLLSQLEIPEACSPCSTPEAQNPLPVCPAAQLRRSRRLTQAPTETCSKSSDPPAQCRRRRRRQKKEGDVQQEATTPPTKRCRPRFEVQIPETPDEDSLSSDFSIELSQQVEQLASFCAPLEEEEETEDEELPSFLMQVDKKPPSIKEGVFVWCKFRNYPFWPAMVKSVNRKQKKASIVFIDGPDIENMRKGFTVALKTLKPFDCEEASELVGKAKEKYEAAIQWSLELITDYGLRIACGSFTGSFTEYFAHNMSYPVRRTYPQAVSERLTIASDTAMEGQPDHHKEESFTEEQEAVGRNSTRLLPDRTHAAHNRANEKLVHFIVKQHMADEHILSVISGKQPSRWLRYFLSSKQRRVANIYLEDDEQLDQVYQYLNTLYEAAPSTAPSLTDVKSVERVPLVLDVLLPEAIIYAIAGVDNVSIKEAEEKYLKGRCISNRERQEFDWIIEQQLLTKRIHLKTHSYPISPLLR